LTSKIPNFGDFFSDLVANACINSLPDVLTKFDVDNIRIVHIMGGSVSDSKLMSGMVIKRGVEGTISRVSKPKVAVYSCPLDTIQGETKGTVLIKNATELLNYSKGEEDLAEKFVQKLVSANINVVVTGGTISDIVLHFLEKYRIMTVKVASKFELRRVTRALSAAALSKLDQPTPEEIGEADEVVVEELGSEKLVVFKRETQDCKLSTIILRGSTRNLLEDIERAIDDAINVYRSVLKDPAFVPGAGSTETVPLKLIEAPLHQAEEGG
jgi:T-complex protein 1 subunit theta